MDKVNFKDLPSRETPINAKNLNKVQDNISKEFDKKEAIISTLIDCISNPVETSGKTIHIEDSSENLCEIEIEGNSKQETREGKNLLELTEGTYTNNGITATIKGGIIAINGTSTALTIMNIALKNQITIPANTNYKLRAFNKQTTNELNRIRLITKEGTNPFDDCFMTNINANVAIGRTTEYTVSALAIRIDNNQTLNNFIIKPQLELGDGTDTFEQGGKSPSPNYLSKIETTGNNINLFDGEYYDGKGYNTNTGALETNANLYCNKNYINILGGQRKITLSKNGVGKNTRFFFYNINKQYISTATGEKNVEIPKNAIYLNFQIAKDTVNNDMSNIKIEQGKPTQYSKYGQGNTTVEICNKNLVCDILKGYNIDSNGIVAALNGYDLNIIKAIKGKTYTILNNTTMAVLGYFDEKPTASSVTYDKSRVLLDTNVYKFTAKRSGYMVIRTLSVDTNIQIEEGSTITPYEEHKEQTYTMPIQEEMLEDDTFDWNNEEEVHTWGNVVLNGTEDFINDTTNSRFKMVLSKDNSYKVSERTKSFSNYYKYGDSTKSGFFGTNVDGTTLYFHYADDVTTIETFKQFLKEKYDAGTPVTIYYKLAQEKRIPFTQEQKEIANKISRAKTYKPVTNIWIDGIGQIKVKYKRDPQTVLEGEV